MLLYLCFVRYMCKINWHEAVIALHRSGEKIVLTLLEKHAMSLNRQGIIYPCSHCKNKRVLEGDKVQSHLIKWGFIEGCSLEVSWQRRCELAVVDLEETRRHRR
jgi:hypothetical protein